MLKHRRYRKPFAPLDEEPSKKTVQLEFCSEPVSYDLVFPKEAQPLLQTEPGGSLRAQNGLKLRWMFTCSYNRSKPGKNQAFLDRHRAMQPLELWKDYAQVLIVRKDQVSEYKVHCGKHYIIAVWISKQLKK